MNDFDNHVIRTLNDTFGSSYTYEQIKTWDFLREMDPEHVQHTWGEKMYHSPEWTASIPILPGVVEGVSMLLRAGYHCRVVTARTKQHELWVRTWLDTHGMMNLDLTCAADKDKAAWAKRYGYTIAIEDAPHHVLALGEVCDKVYMIRKPYNSHIAKVPHPHAAIIPVDSLLEAAERIVGAEPKATCLAEREHYSDSIISGQSHTPAGFGY